MRKTKTKKWLTSLFAAGSLWASAQTNFRCDNTAAGPGNPPPSFTPCGSVLDSVLKNLGPQIDSINVNMIFFKPSSGTGIYDNYTQANAQALLNSINSLFANLSAPHRINTNPAGLITDSRIRFRLKSFSKIVDATAYSHTGFGGNKSHLYGYIDSNAVNVFWAYDFAPTNCGGGGYSWDIPHYCISMGLCGTDSPSNYTGGLSHELGHALGLAHTDAITGKTNNGSMFVNDYSLEDSTVWQVPGPCALTPPTTSLPYSNNIMAYNWQCRNYLSPQQLGFIKYLFKSEALTKRFVHNYNYSCNVDYSKNVNITTNQTWTNPKSFLGDVSVKPGVHLTINCEVSFSKNAKLIIEPGAKVTLGITGQLLTHCNALWGGVEVQGNTIASQYIDPATNMSPNQGYLVINGGSISDAKIGVALYARDASDNYISGTSGGIVHSKDGYFLNNYISAEFKPYDFTYHDPLLYHNFSYFKNSVFTLTKSYSQPGYYPTNVIKYKHTANPLYGLSLNGVRDVEVAGCTFNDMHFKTSNLINCFDASVKAQDYCTNASGSTCVGTLLNNNFRGGNYGIYISNISGYYISLIDNANFGIAPLNNPSGTAYQEKGCIYLNNASYSQISNNEFMLNSNNIGKVRYGIYADNSTGYVIESNNFYATPVISRKNSVGVFINNSGPFANSVYNNTFLDLDQGIWAQNQNVDVSTGVGLKMNCNDFTTCKFNIGVQKSGRTVAGQPNNTGVDATQGVADPLIQTNNVRNTYGVTPTSCGSENKFYVNTSNTFTTSHGSFLGALYHPTPQPACSNSVEVTDIVGPNAPVGGKPTYCPSTISSSFSSRLMQNKIEQLVVEIKKQEDELKNMTDDTQTSKSAGNGGKNANGTMSSYQLAQAKLNLNKTELGLMINEKIRRLLNDSTCNATDSILDIVDRFNLPNKKVLKSAIYLAAKKYTSASTVINQNKNTQGLNDYCDLQKTALDFYTTAPNQRKSFVLQNKVQLQNWANSYDMFLEGAAKGLLASAGLIVEEELLYPTNENNMRLAQDETSYEEDNGTIKVYPNPANNSITVELENNNAELIELRDITGKVLLSQKAEFKTQINLSNFENGIYFINLVEGKTTTHSSKIVLIK